MTDTTASRGGAQDRPTGFDVASLAAWTGGELVCGAPNTALEGVVIDSRKVQPGQLFVAVRGPNHDAHRFLDNVAAAGAGALLVCRDADLGTLRDGNPGIAIVAVDDTTAGLGALAAGHRQRFDGPVLAITGSSGKTTTKEMTAAVMEAAGPCLKTQGNLNNEFGLPLTLLSRRPEHTAAVVELGMNHRGEIAALAAIARPTVGLITNVGTAHIEYLGSRDEIAREKGDLFAALDEDGCAVVNRDDDRVSAQASRVRGQTLGYGVEHSAEFSATHARYLDEGAFAFELRTPDGARQLRVAGLSETTIINSLAAAAAAWACGVKLDAIAEGLEAFGGVGGRMARHALPNGATLIDDTYNANPQSMRAALESVAQLKGNGRALAVLGDMGELGDAAAAAHRDLGRWSAELGIDLVFAQGPFAALVAEGAEAAGLSSSALHVSDDHEQTTTAIRAALRPGDWVLVKGSRAMKMERIVESLSGGTS